MTPAAQTRLFAAASIAIVVPAGLAVRFAGGTGSAWLDNFAGEVLYEMFWMMLALIAFPRRSAVLKIGLAVLAATCGLELLQLWHTPVLDGIRSTAVGRLLIGHQFDPMDFVGYFIGCAIGVLWQFGWFAFMLRRSGPST